MFKFEKAVPEDFDAIIAFGRSEGIYPTWPEEEVSRCLRGGILVKALDEDKIIAVRYGEPFCGEYFLSLGMFVKDSYRSQGVGSKLSDLYFTLIKESGCNRVITANSNRYLHLYKNPRPGKAVEFYFNQGYELVDKTETTTLLLKKLD